MPDQRRNGSGNLTYKWLVGVLLTLLVGGGMGWMSSLNAQVTTIANITSLQGERLSAVETMTKSIDKSLADIRDTLHRVEDRVQVVGDRKR